MKNKKEIYEDKKTIVETMDFLFHLCREYQGISLTYGTLCPNVTDTGTDFSFVACNASARELPSYVKVSDGHCEKIVCIEADSGSAVIKDVLRGVYDIYGD